MKSKGLVTKVVPVLKKDGEWVRNPLVRTDTYVDDGEIVYGEAVASDKIAAAKALIAECKTDFELLDAEDYGVLRLLCPPPVGVLGVSHICCATA